MKSVASLPTVSRPGIGAKALIGLAGLVAITFVVMAALPYRAMFGSEAGARATLQDFQFAFWPRRGWLLIHIAGGLIALLSGPVQLWLGLHDLKMKLHRKLGMLYMAGMAIGSVGAVGLALQTDGGLIFGSGLLGLALAWITTTSFAYIAIRKGIVEQHREWTIRSYVVTFAFVTFRAVQIAMVGAGVPLLTAIGVMAWACWAVPLLITELVIQGRKLGRPRTFNANTAGR
jgi:heme/copper-type cytochrome/quinol oxidase subunit 3